MEGCSPHFVPIERHTRGLGTRGDLPPPRKVQVPGTITNTVLVLVPGVDTMVTLYLFSGGGRAAPGALR